MALEHEEVRFLEKCKSYVRPTFAYAATFCMVLIVFTVCYAVLTKLAKLEDATALLMAIIPSIMTPMAVYFGGRSYEKSNDQAHYDEPEDYEEGIEIPEIEEPDA